jgi:hypothetical protein
MTREAAAHRIAMLERELKSVASQTARNMSEREEIACRVLQIQRDIELVRSGQFSVGN